MSITPIEEDGEHRDGDPSGRNEVSGVRGFVASVVAGLRLVGRRLLGQLRDPFGVAPQRSGSAHSQRGVTGQKRLTAGEESSEQPQPLPDGVQVCTEQEADALRVYDPEQSEAYITSDTWEAVEQ
jgi:hypothetical protein